MGFDGESALPREEELEHARDELRASGEHVRPRTEPATSRLTPQELHVALVVAHGATNREAAAQLFVSPKTIERHLGNVYGKLGLRSRAELARVVTAEEANAPGGLPTLTV